MLLNKDKLIIQIGAVQFHSHKELNPKFQLDPTAIAGWYDGVDADRSEAKRPTSDGDYPEPSTLSSRTLTISGTTIAVDEADLTNLRDQFISLFYKGGYREIAVTDNTGTRYMEVGLASAPRWTRMLDNVAVWKMDLYAPDPFLYGALKTRQIFSANSQPGGLEYFIRYPISFGAGTEYRNAVLYNKGSVPSWPTFTVRGEYPSGFTIRSPKGKEISYRGIVSHSAPVEIDAAKGSAVVNGVDRSYELSKREWFFIPPYTGITPKFIPVQESDGWVDVEYRDTWL